LEVHGTQVDAKFIYQQLDALGINNIREYLEEAYMTIIGIPDRKTRGGGGGDTGDAVKLRDGWQDLEIVARIKESYFKIAKKKQIAVAIRILQKAGEIGSELKTIDVDVRFSRNKTDNIQSKAQAFATFNGTKTIAPDDALEFVDATNNAIEVIERGQEFWEKKEREKLELELEFKNKAAEAQAKRDEAKAKVEIANRKNEPTSLTGPRNI